MKKQILIRFLLSILAGILLAVTFNEVSFWFLKSEAGRGPQEIELVIPAGTAEQVARGEGNSALPENMVFVTGDTLIVRNEDVEAHTLGPLFIPPGTSASLVLDQAQNLAYSCSFQPGDYLGLDVREPVTWETRVYGILFGGIPLGALMGLYSLLVWPLKAKEQQPQAA